MGAARYVGRVGGLAVALGVGVAVFTGQGTAWADSGGGDTGKSTTSTSHHDVGASADKSPGKAKKGPRASTGSGRHAIADDTPASSTAASITKRLSDTAAPTRAATKRAATATAVAVDDSAASADTATAAEDAPARALAKEWINSPRVKAGRAVADQTADAGTAAPATVTHVLAAVDAAVTPSSGNGTPAAPTNSPIDLLAAAAVRREVSTAALDVDPYTIGITQGVIGGCVVSGCPVTSHGIPLSYTVLGAPSLGGKVSVNPTTGAFTYLPFAAENSLPDGVQSFRVYVAQVTALDTFLTGLPLVGSSLVAPTIMLLQQIPVIRVVLAPLIGSATTQVVEANIDALRAAAGDPPIAYTTMVTSWDGTQISTNFFPGIGTPNEDGTYPTILNGPGLAQPGATDPTDPFVATFRSQGYNVVTWDPRGEFASGGVLQLDNPQFEGQDVTRLINWLATKEGVQLDGVNDPRLGMVGVSYGGGIQLVTAANDHRVDAIAPGWAWNSLPGSLYPDDAFKTAYAALLLLGLVTTGATINSQIYGGILTGGLLGVLTPSQIALLTSSGPGFTAGNITAPTLLIQGTVDVLFPLQQSIINAGLISTPQWEGDTTAPTKVIWFCGGHGSCLPGQGDPAADNAWMMMETVGWMNTYVKGDGTGPTGPMFEWSDQNGDYWYSDHLPSAVDFNDPTRAILTTGTGKVLPIIPILGGSGPAPQVDLPYSLGDGSVASNAVNIALTNPVQEGDDPIPVVGAPTLTMSYSGIGTSRHVYAQIVDKNTGLVVGNLVTPVPVTLDGQEHQVTVALNDIAYTLDADSNLELQIVTTATPYLNLTQFGFINVGGVSLSLPVPTSAVQELPAMAVDDDLVAV